MNKQKGLAPILIVFLIALTVGGYLLYQKQTKPAVVLQPVTQPLSSPVTSPTATNSAEMANWKTYTDAHGLSFEYPEDWSVSAGEFLIILPQYRSDQIKGGSSKLETEAYPREKYSPITLSIGVYKPDIADSTKEITKRSISVAGGAVSEYIIKFLDSSSGYPKNLELRYVVIEGNSQMYVYRLYNPQFKDIFYQILSTFKFTQ